MKGEYELMKENQIGNGLVQDYRINDDIDQPSDEELGNEFKCERLKNVSECRQLGKDVTDGRDSLQSDKDTDAQNSQQYNNCPSHQYRNDGQPLKHYIDYNE